MKNQTTTETAGASQNGAIVTHPNPGETAWDKHGKISEDAARELAEMHWDVLTVSPGPVTCGTEWHVKTNAGWSAIVGRINGDMAILNKHDDGSRSLYVYPA